MNTVDVRDVHQWYGVDAGRTEVLRGVSLQVPKGEFLAIMGASGSGKSTLMNLIGLLDSPSAGHIFFDGRDVSKLTEDESAQLRASSIGFIFQSFNLLPYLTACENIELGMTYGQRPNARQRALDLLSRVRLDHRAQAYPRTLSGGERQRVAIARALANEPLLILADEPTGALDSRTGVEILELIGELHRQGTTVILVTHDDAVARRAQRIVRMKDGRFEA